ncbi:sugar isomerase, KpsF/GutQ family [Candidatus Moduliflexus flocculans]|uniref:Sugar isomerase, KpsF/GutQ family n=1 Tax=Candidatus Moduliflexus flocculans TaxID=1499966 RepID=A0A0S6VRX0_9BACT|nr:sugar isomerase, KpsF/GutQ family [Candidatus Moduliflexus flocculans]
MIPKTLTSRVGELLEAEADAIDKVVTQLEPEQIERALMLLAECQQKIVVIGVGKSGIIAQKIAATICSIGMVAIALHPGDALHGDLGVVQEGDVGLVLSASGESDEIITLLPHLKRRSIPIIAIVGNLDSTLARQADVVINATIDREICPLNLAPTASTTVALALGDALVMTLMEVKQVKPEDFAINHPAGRLGKRLTVKVGDLMHNDAEHPTLSPQASWLDVLNAITRGGMGAVNIVDKTGRLVGLVTDGDLRRWMQKTNPAELEMLTAQTIMTSHPVVISPDTLAYEALQLMENRPSQISVLPVIDRDGKCLGLVRLHDIVRYGL